MVDHTEDPAGSAAPPNPELWKSLALERMFGYCGVMPEVTALTYENGTGGRRAVLVRPPM